MYNQCRAWSGCQSVAGYAAQSFFRIDFSILADYLVGTLRYIDACRFIFGVQDNGDVLPGITVGSSVNPESYYVIVLHIQKFQVFVYQFGIAQVEGRMSLAHGNQSFQVVECFPMDGLAGPVDGIDGIRTVVGIAYTFLVAHDFILSRMISSPVKMNGTPCEVNTAVCASLW